MKDVMNKPVSEIIDEFLNFVRSDAAIIEPVKNAVIVYTGRGRKIFDRKGNKLVDALATLCEQRKAKKLMVRRGGEHRFFL